MKANSIETAQASRFGLVQAGILMLGLATALVHLIILNSEMIGLKGHIDLLFTLNGLGYLSLLGAFFLPVPFLRQYHGWVRLALIGFTILTILAWVIMGRPYTTLGYLTKAIEILLIILLVVDGQRR